MNLVVCNRSSLRPRSCSASVPKTFYTERDNEKCQITFNLWTLFLGFCVYIVLLQKIHLRRWRRRRRRRRRRKKEKWVLKQSEQKLRRNFISNQRNGQYCSFILFYLCCKKISVVEVESVRILQCTLRLLKKTKQTNKQNQYICIDWLMITYITLFSALLSRLTALACGSTWVTSFIARFWIYPPKWCTYSAGMTGATENCSRLGAHTTMHNVTSCKATYVRCMRV